VAKKKIHRRVRRGGAPQLPVQAERDFARALVRMASAFGKRLRAIGLPLAKKIGLPPPERADANIERAPETSSDTRASAKSAKAQVERAAKESFNDKALRAEAARASRRVDSHSKDQFRKLGIDPKKEPVLGVLVQGWTRDVSQRVSDLGKEQAKKLEAILLSGQTRHAATLAREIEEQLGVAQSRAEFIARDSIGVLNSKVTRARYLAADIESYIWTTMSDDRVRDAHEALDGVVFDVDGPGDPDEGHPGEAPNCRCVQFPLKHDAPADEGEE
jgi:SPP1 gp7 family putative phage head morphogenesis protein